MSFDIRKRPSCCQLRRQRNTISALPDVSEGVGWKLQQVGQRLHQIDGLFPRLEPDECTKREKQRQSGEKGLQSFFNVSTVHQR